MTASDRPTVDVRAPNGGRIVLWPAMGTQRLPGLSRWSLAAVVTLAVVFLAASVTPLNHTDLWGHLYFGRWIVEHGRLPPSDPFRPGVGVEPFLNVPWLAQVLGYLAVNTLGLEGLVLGQAVLVTLSAAGVMLAVRGRGVPAGWATAAAAASYLLALPVEGTIRPQLFGVVAFSATLWAAARLPVRRHPLLWLPPLFALWANVHGSFPMGLAVLACLAVSETWEARAAHRTLLAACREKAVRRAWLALVASVAGACLNPCGPYLLLAVAGFAGNGNLEGISEWRPMVLGSLSGVLFFGSLLVTALLLRLSPRRISLLEILLFLLLATASLSAIRMMAWWAIVWPWIVAPHAAAVWLLYRRTRPAEAPAPGQTVVPRLRGCWRQRAWCSWRCGGRRARLRCWPAARARKSRSSRPTRPSPWPTPWSASASTAGS